MDMHKVDQQLLHINALNFKGLKERDIFILLLKGSSKVVMIEQLDSEQVQMVDVNDWRNTYIYDFGMETMLVRYMGNRVEVLFDKSTKSTKSTNQHVPSRR